MDCISTTSDCLVTNKTTLNLLIISIKTSRCKFSGDFLSDLLILKVIFQVIFGMVGERLKPVVYITTVQSRVAALTKFEILAGNPITKRRYAKNDKNKNH